MIPGLALHLLVSIGCFLFWLPIDWPDASWDRTDGYYAIRSGTTHTTTTAFGLITPNRLSFVSPFCILENEIFISCDLTFPECFSIEKDHKGSGRGHMSPAVTRIPVTRWGQRHLSRKGARWHFLGQTLYKWLVDVSTFCLYFSILSCLHLDSHSTVYTYFRELYERFSEICFPSNWHRCWNILL